LKPENNTKKEKETETEEKEKELNKKKIEEEAYLAEAHQTVLAPSPTDHTILVCV
jgi:hypothetical protein